MASVIPLIIGVEPEAAVAPHGKVESHPESEVSSDDAFSLAEILDEAAKVMQV